MTIKKQVKTMTFVRNSGAEITILQTFEGEKGQLQRWGSQSIQWCESLHELGQLVLPKLTREEEDFIVDNIQKVL